MARDSRKMRGDGPFLFAQVKNGIGVADVAEHVIRAWRAATAVTAGGTEATAG